MHELQSSRVDLRDLRIIFVVVLVCERFIVYWNYRSYFTYISISVYISIYIEFHLYVTISLRLTVDDNLQVCASNCVAVLEIYWFCSKWAFVKIQLLKIF